MKGKNLFDKFSMAIDLPSEPTPGQTVLELFGSSRVLIENHMGITQYNANEIRVKSKSGCLIVRGNSLYVAKMTSCQLIIRGCVECIENRRLK